MNNLVEKRIIKDKPIFIFESHHFALYPWAWLRSQFKSAPLLFSLDHHTDTHIPFLNECYVDERIGHNSKLAKKYVEEIDFRKMATIENAIKKLRNDEHIKTAIEADIIDKAFIISYNNTTDFPLSYEENKRVENWMEIHICDMEGKEHPLKKISRPFNYPNENIYIPSIYSSNTSEQIDLFNMAIETNFLREKFQIFSEMSPENVKLRGFTKKYILDIDLDYFHTQKSIKPYDNSFFIDLVKNAEIITIAKESVCIDLLKEEYGISDEIDSNYLLDKLLDLFNRLL